MVVDGGSIVSTMLDHHSAAVASYGYGWTTTATATLLTATTTAPVSPEPIHTAFSVATFFPQPFWLLLILFPNSSLTKQVMGGMEVILLCSLIHLFIVVASIGSDPTATAPIGIFADVFDIMGDGGGDRQAAFMDLTTFPNFIAEEWSHVLSWDLFVGRYIWLDGVQRNIPTRWSVLLCNLIGPPGLMLHFVTCILQGKPLYDANPTTRDDA
jgi:Domain of unknown function (DUF4281)